MSFASVSNGYVAGDAGGLHQPLSLDDALALRLASGVADVGRQHRALGLARHLTEAMAGTFALSRTVGEGTHVTVTLPTA